jgi:hypothetical protein
MVWGFNGSTTQVFQSVTLYRPVASMTIHENIILMGFVHGDTSLYIWGLDPLRRLKEQASGEILKLETRTADHEGGLTATDFHPILRLYVTGGLD